MEIICWINIVWWITNRICLFSMHMLFNLNQSVLVEDGKMKTENVFWLMIYFLEESYPILFPCCMAYFPSTITGLHVTIINILTCTSRSMFWPCINISTSCCHSSTTEAIITWHCYFFLEFITLFVVCCINVLR
jgi:hypothetical protein